jgi:two-component system chemotaxis response regulator CheY
MKAVLRRILSKRNFDVAEADNGQQALEVLSRIATVDLVLVSWIPQETECVEFIARLRRKSAHDSIVIMLTTIEPGIRDLQRALIAGANDYLMQPFTSLQFDEMLVRLGFTSLCCTTYDR